MQEGTGPSNMFFLSSFRFAEYSHAHGIDQPDHSFLSFQPFLNTTDKCASTAEYHIEKTNPKSDRYERSKFSADRPTLRDTIPTWRIRKKKDCFKSGSLINFTLLLLLKCCMNEFLRTKKRCQSVRDQPRTIKVNFAVFQHTAYDKHIFYNETSPFFCKQSGVRHRMAIGAHIAKSSNLYAIT